jgi:hypothetical protein
MSYDAPRLDFLYGCIGHAAEEEVGHVPLKDDDFTVGGQQSCEHANCALQDCDHGQHRSYAKGYAGYADQCANAMPSKISKNQLEEDHTA